MTSPGGTPPTSQDMSRAFQPSTIPVSGDYENDLPPSVLFPFWTYAYATPYGATLYQGSQQGCYYQQDGTLISFEFWVDQYGTGENVYFHYIVAYDQTDPGQWYIYYFEVDTDPGNEPDVTIGAQGELGEYQTIFSMSLNQFCLHPLDRSQRSSQTKMIFFLSLPWICPTQPNSTQFNPIQYTTNSSPRLLDRNHSNLQSM